MPTHTERHQAELSAVAALDDDTRTAKVSASTASANLKLAPGVYKVALRGADPTCHVYLNPGADNTVTAAEPADRVHQADASGFGAAGEDQISFRGDEVERITVTASRPWIAYVLSAGAATAKLVFTRVVAGT